MKIFFILLIFALSFVACVRFIESRSVFYPVRFLSATPDDIGLPYEDVYMITPDRVRIHGWLVKSPGAKSTLLFFHGNAGNIGDRLEKIDFFHSLRLNVLIIDYRGYGKSGGRPTERGIYADAQAAYGYLAGRQDLKGQAIIAYGASLGGAVAIDLASRNKISVLIVDSTFTSAADIAQKFYPFIPGFLLKTKLDSIGKIGKVSAPKLFLHSPEDEIVPYAFGKKLFEAAGDPKRFLKTEGGHNDGYSRDQSNITEGITGFLREQGLI